MRPPNVAIGGTNAKRIVEHTERRSIAGVTEGNDGGNGEDDGNGKEAAMSY